jgi:hypothetical protein
MKLKRVFVVMALFVALFLMGNAPAPYWACEGRAVGDACTYGYGSCAGSNGACQLEGGNCEDNPNTEINECLICVTR